jgi:hypothetical protein
LIHFFCISLVHENEVDEIDLVSGSHPIPDQVHADPRMGRKDKYSERRLGTTWNALQEHDDRAGGDPKGSFRILVGGKEAGECKFIKLQKRKK